MSDRHFDYDCIFVGGGLANCLFAYWMKKNKPELKLLVLEKADRLGGNHTWSFHERDLSVSQMDIIKPFISKEWPGYTVAFPKYNRKISSRYFSVRSESFYEKIIKELTFEFGVDVMGVAPHNVTAKGTKNWSARCVVDGRGFAEINPEMVGYQKFLGLEITLESPHGLTLPLLMDAKCPQENSFRFFYCLPWDERTLLIEDTRYSDTGEVDLDYFRAEIKKYCDQKGWKILKIGREEVGSLPIPLRARFLGFNDQNPDQWVQKLVSCVGVRGGFFHSTTGYSLSEAIRLVHKLKNIKELSHEVLLPMVSDESKKTVRRQWFFRLLNRMLFAGIEPNSRYRMLEFFYKMPQGLIGRFYRGRLWPTDYLRIFIGVPPIKVKAALKCLLHNRERTHG